jgi:hypothetical protein
MALAQSPQYLLAYQEMCLQVMAQLGLAQQPLVVAALLVAKFLHLVALLLFLVELLRLKLQ